MLPQLLFYVLMLGSLGSLAQNENALVPRQTGDVLGQLESMGVQVLSGILSPSATASTVGSTSETSTSAASTSASTSASASATSASSPSQHSASAAAASASSATPTALLAVGRENTRHRNIAIIIGSVLGGVVLLLFLALLWFCCFSKRGRRRRGKTAAARKEMDDDELDGWTPGGPDTAYVTRIESWHEPRASRNSSRGPTQGSKSRVSLVQRDPISERYGNAPSAPVPLPIPPPHRVSQYGLIQNENPFDEPNAGYFDRPQRHSMDDAVRDRNKYPGYVPYRSSQSTHSLVERTPTPLFGSGKTPGEQNTIKRKSVSSGPTAVNSVTNSKDPSPQHSNGVGPWVPPKNPSRRRESLPGSPLAHEFEFGFDDQSRRVSGGRPRMPGGWSNTSVTDAHQRF
jgi:hypothetical protein